MKTYLKDFTLKKPKIHEEFMIQSIETKGKYFYSKYINPYLPSKQQLKTAVKVTTIAFAAFTTISVVAFATYYNHSAYIPWLIPPKKVSVITFYRSILEKIYNNGLKSSIQNRSELFKMIKDCTYYEGYFHRFPKIIIDPWYIGLKNNILLTLGYPISGYTCGKFFDDCRAIMILTPYISPRSKSWNIFFQMVVPG